MLRNLPHRVRIALLFSLPAAAFGAPKRPSPPAPPPAPLIKFVNSAAPLTGPWKFSPGDSPWTENGPLWAQTGFDDSGWATLDLTSQGDPFDLDVDTQGFVPGWTARGFPQLTGFAWYRLDVHVANSGEPLAIKMPAQFDDAYQLYADGQLVGQFGNFDSSPPITFFSRPAVFALPQPEANGEIEVALRFYMSLSSPLGASSTGGMHQAPVLGPAFTLDLIQSVQNSSIAYSRFGSLLTTLLFLLIAPVALWFWLQNRREHAFLWLFLVMANTIAWDSVDAIASASSQISSDTALFVLVVLLGSTWLPGWIMVWWYWFGLRGKRWIPHLAWYMAGANFLASLGSLSSFGILSFLPLDAREWLHNFSLLMVISTCLLLLVVLFWGYRRDRTEGLLALGPVLLLELAALSYYVAPRLNFPYPAFRLFSLTIDLSTFSSMVMALAVGALALRRFLRTRVGQELARQSIEQELAQARELQQHVLIPEEIHSPDYDVEVQYHPAQTVGGDFFQTILGPNGNLLVVIGDVSGKGISAAMLVSVLVGAARTRATDSFDPASMLAVLNQRLLGRSGGHFATCLVAEFQADGRLRIANAGHIAPYLNGAEVALTGSLPLGLTGKIEPSLQAMQLRPGDKLTFLTDGIVEARNPSGELFGFERARIVCNEPIAEIVRRAQQFGQNDDITALRVAYTGGRREIFASARAEAASSLP
jgi:hypothetical protein